MDSLHDLGAATDPGADDPYLLADEDEDSDPTLEGFGDDYFAGLDDDDELDEDAEDDEDLDEDAEEDEELEGEDDVEAGEEDDDPDVSGPRRDKRIRRRNLRQADRREDRAERLQRQAQEDRETAREHAPPRKKKKKKGQRKAGAETASDHRRLVVKRKMSPEYLMSKGYSKSVLSGAVKTATKGKETISIDVESNFITESLVMEGSATGSVVYTVWVGESPVWRSSAGTPCSVFAVNSTTLAGNIAGHLLRPGQKIKVDVETAADNDTVRVTFIGWKKTHASVC